MGNIRAVLDACVLYPAPLRDTLVSLAYAHLYQARWTDAIHEEWIRNVLKNRNDLSNDQLQYTRRRMNEAIDDCLVSEYEHLTEALELPDPNDRHVLAAAIHCDADTIVTFNKKDFPDDKLRPHGVTRCDPDMFICGLIAINPLSAFATFQEQRKRMKNPPHDPEEFIANLDRNGLVETGKLLRQHITLL